jgi:hypothetical protein
MFWRRRTKHDTELIAAALLDLNGRVATLEQAVLTLCDHVEALEQKPRVARVLQNTWPVDGKAIQ